MAELNECDVIRVMREEWQKRIKSLNEAIDLKLGANVAGDDKEVISKGLKLRHKESQLRYTVDSISRRDVVLRTPEGDTFTLTKDELEREYEVD